MRLTDIASRLAEIREYISKRSAAGSDFSDVITIDTLYADINILHGEVADAVRAEALLPTMYLAHIETNVNDSEMWVVHVREVGAEASIDSMTIEFRSHARAALLKRGYRVVGNVSVTAGNTARFVVVKEG
jgi:hypothetical protein